MIITGVISKVRRFYYAHRFKLVKTESETFQKINAALSYNITWGLTIMIGFLQIFSLIYKMDAYCYILIPSVIALYVFVVYMIFVKRIWRFVIHAYCILTLLVMCLQIYKSHYDIDINVMLGAAMVIFMAFSLPKKEIVSVYIVAALAIFLIFLFQSNIRYSTPNRLQFIYIAIYSMLVLSFVAFICHHFIRSMYLVIRKLQFTANKKKILSEKLVRITEETRQSLLNKDEFLSTMSHELRSPLNTVIGFADLLQEEELSAKQKESLNYLQNSAKNLLDLINDVLDYNKFESGNLILEKGSFGIKEMLIASDSIFQQRIKNEEIKLSIRLDVNLNNKFFLGDKVRIQQMIYNLIYVAYKINVHALVELELFLGEMNAAKEREVVFNVFFKGFNKYLSYLSPIYNENEGLFDRSVGDSLLYLHTEIAKKIAQAMDAQLDYNYDEFTNSSNIKFKVLWSEIQRTQSHEGFKKANFNGLKILVVDDQELNVLLITKFLKKMGTCVKVAHCGQDAINQACNNDFDLILMDLNMPDVDGFDASKVIKNVDRNVRVIALTGEEKAMICDKLSDAQIDGYLQKPVDTKALYFEMNRVLRFKQEPIVA